MYDEGSKPVGVDCERADDVSCSEVQSKVRDEMGHKGIDVNFPTFDVIGINSEIDKVDEGANDVNTKEPEVSSSVAGRVPEGDMITDVDCIAYDMGVVTKSRYCDCVRDDGSMEVCKSNKLGSINDDGSIDVSINDSVVYIASRNSDGVDVTIDVEVENPAGKDAIFRDEAAVVSDVKANHVDGDIAVGNTKPFASTGVVTS